ncbi:MAG: VWA domain-containing protein [Kiloniellales bacterium]|nr:VWA domain-containing protein [Kiloniellales bacterium]MDJ0968801.1 VWA domain-containing protein [Kiloniellales bacterium]
MIDFARPWAFLLLPLPVLAWFALAHLPERGAVRVPLSVWHWMRALSGDRSSDRARSPTGLALRTLGWLLLVTALAGPYSTGAALLTPTGRDLIVAVDLSASMAEKDMSGPDGAIERISAVRDLVGAFVAERRGDRIGLIGFASDAYLIAPLTFDTRAVAQMLDELAIGLPGRKTDLGRAVGLSVQVLKKEPPAERLLVILSDGEANSGDLSALDAAALADETGITVHTIGFAREIDGANARFMQDIAAQTGGHYFDARTPERLGEIYKEISRIAPVSADADRPRLLEDWTWMPLILALGLLSLIGWRELREA